MKDIDFDELDRAVSSLLGKPGGSELPAAPKQQQSTPKPAAPTQEQTQVVSPTPPPAEQKTTPASVTATPSPQPQAQQEQRSTVPRPPVAPRFTPNRPPSTPQPVQPRRNDTQFPITPSSSKDFNTPQPQQASTSQKSEQRNNTSTDNQPPVRPQPPTSAESQTQPKTNTTQESVQNQAKPAPQKPQMQRPASNGRNRFMDVVHPAAANQPEAIEKPVRNQPFKKPTPPPQQPPSVKQATAPSPAPKTASDNNGQQQPSKTSIVKRGGAMGAPSMPSRVSHAGKTIETPTSPKPSTFVDSLIPKLRQATQKRSPEPPKEQASQNAPATQEKPAEKTQHQEELLTAQAGKPADEQQRRIAEGIPSPFLTNTKVEKRPLGGGSVPSGASHSDTSTVKQTLDAEATRLDQQAEDKSFYDDKQNTNTGKYEAITDGYYDDELGAAPAEFSQDVVAAEAADPEIADQERPDTPPAYPPERQKPAPAPAVTTATQASRAAETATMSIPQQYRAKTATPDKTPRSIYDTEEYHKPLPTASPKKKKSHPVIWILLIILLLAVGAGLGVAAYFLLG